MPSYRTLALAATIAGLIGTTTRGDVILTLGVTSDTSGRASSSPPSPAIPAPVAPGGGWNFSQATATSPAPSVPAPAPAATGTNLAAPSPAIAPASFGGNGSFAPTAPMPSPAQATYDAFVNLGTGPFASSGTLTTGNAQPWYDSSKVMGLFGGSPTAQQRSDFDATVLQRVERTFQLGGVAVNLTSDPNAPAAHSLSVVSNAVNPSLGSAIGMTYVGGDGFHYIDNSARYARNVDQLEWIVAHNVAHELMLAFGVPEVHDQSGRFIDSTLGRMAMFLNPTATFSPGAIQDLLSKDFRAGNGPSSLAGPQLIDGSPVPEPTTWLLWGLGALAVVGARHRSRSSRASA